MMTTNNIRGLLLVLVLLLGLSTPAAAQNRDSEKLLALLTEFLDGAARNDAAVHDRFWSEDLIYTRSAGVRIDKAELMNGVRSAKPKAADDPVATYKAEDVLIRQFGKTAVVAFKLVATTKSDGAEKVDEYLNTGTFLKNDGTWRVVAWQSTPIPKAASASAVTDKPAAVSPAGDRRYQTGPRGGCFYVDGNGKKIYVKKDLCSQN